MEHFRIYIDTSVLGGCFDPEFASWSNGLMRDFRAGRLVPVLSDVTAAEVASAPAPVRDLHQELLGVNVESGYRVLSIRSPREVTTYESH